MSIYFVLASPIIKNKINYPIEIINYFPLLPTPVRANRDSPLQPLLVEISIKFDIINEIIKQPKN
ncbi:MAG: hypothetical protein F6K17_15000 [Okeania sp. SIO3C4]|nr:hypothetical protein [Okeania sp. SIO3B3]NER03833.1 hypothetical protein [Okeania sp. SIO3C4]